MANKIVAVKLDCGVEAKTWIYDGMEWLRISLIDLYNGYGSLSSTILLSKLFTELAEKGYTTTGLSREEGYYGSTDDLLMDVNRKKTK